MKKYGLALHVFRRDLRLEDNTALIAALKSSEKVIPCFIFDPRQIEKNDYKSTNCIQFMVNSLHVLDMDLKEQGGQLYLAYGEAEEVIAQLLKAHPIEAVFINHDYTPFSRKRDEKIKLISQQHHVIFSSHEDALLLAPEEVKKANQEPYTIFTPFYNKAMSLPLKPIQKNRYDNYYHGTLTLQDSATLRKLAAKKNVNLFLQGGRKEGIHLLKNITSLKAYDIVRDIPARSASSHLSAHNKFGTVSIREVYTVILNTFDKYHGLIKELFWRDFFTHVAWHFPHVFGHAFYKKYDRLNWSKSQRKFQAWCQGETGFPIVDAGMRELNTTGYMQNRVRMITASFLTKDLHIDWRQGEKYFAQHLIDYDPAINNGNWQWAASTGCDAQPYFRIFNPWLQQEKFDSDCLYIKKWIPELARIPAKVIHQLAKRTQDGFTNYPHPIIDHQIESAKSKSLYATQA